jgi:hypothetical protein
VDRATQLQARPWCISQAGFTPEAMVYAADHDIFISDAGGLAALERAAS